MTALPSSSEKLRALTHAACDGALTERDAAQLEELLRGNPEAQQFYLDRVGLDGWLRWEFAHEVPVPPLLPSPAPILTFLDSPVHGAVGYFSGWPVAYLIATVIFGIGLLVGAVVQVSEPVQIARQSSLPSRMDAEPKMELVGSITGMVDCKWVQSSESRVQSPALDPRLSSLVSLGDKFALSSGLMEITYNTGAKVILQGPVTYEVESAAGGFLSVGKLTARLGERGETSPNLQISKSPNSNPQSLIPNPSLSTIHYPLFTIKTPTAVVTDLGTEFGVEVDKQGGTTSHVFCGLVRVQMVAADGNTQGTGQVLHENESVRVDAGQGQSKIVVVPAAKSANFVREMPRPTIKTLDLVDVVAGGDGFSGRRNRGIDPTTGQIVDALIGPEVKNPLSSDGKYHRVEGMPFIDGACIPDGSKDMVQVDSAGHEFGGFQGTANTTWQSVWAGGVIPKPPLAPTDYSWPSEKVGGVDYASSGHGLIFLHANSAITFNLRAIRQANPGSKLLRFRATAANAEPPDFDGLADVWVLVDGQSRFQRREINNTNGVFSALVPIGDKDHFLTLAATSANDGIHFDWIIFGDPRMELLPVETKEQMDTEGH